MTDLAQRQIEIESDTARGRGDYTAFHALWHLAEIGVVTDLKSFASEAWDLAAERLDGEGQRSTRVALIDTSVAAGHPNLADAINARFALDLFSSRMGVPGARDAYEGILGDDNRTLPEDFPDGAAQLWADLQDHLKSGPSEAHASPVRAANAPNFSAHGTAMAGLIGARPVACETTAVAQVRVFDPTTGTYSELPMGQSVAFAYSGVDPFCEIVPISTNFDPEPEQLILALLYAALIDADVIVLARDFPAPASLAPGVEHSPEALSRALGVDVAAHEIERWTVLEELTIALSKRVPIVCAAGNGAQQRILYPGSLAADGNGIISVGARTAAGQSASYSPVSDHVTVYAPSGDGERLDDKMQRLDVQSAGFNPNDHSQFYRGNLGSFGDPSNVADVGPGTHAPQDLISTDVPGRAGYNSSPNAQVFGRDGAILDYRSAYCRFSGTSGAVALTGGLLSLALSAGRLTKGGAHFGVNAKAALCGGAAQSYAKAEPAIHWRNLSPDVGDV
ncbi:S8 family serine peptidase [Roseovarius sp. Pro17]|uniref:S8 family serine peptidase n=1 Tax=Roseovarius sp. Pro17 TaxID=3108175 RepID=UPI002D7968ED|nr:S8 family serine peptidase [Roseovarius sp. Pro17]